MQFKKCSKGGLDSGLGRTGERINYLEYGQKECTTKSGKVKYGGEVQRYEGENEKVQQTFTGNLRTWK